MSGPVTTNTAPFSESSWECMITFELIDEGSENDPALINAVGATVLNTSQQDGYVIGESIYTGQKGGFLVELVIMLQQASTMILNNHAAIAEGIADISGLITIFTAILPLLKRMREAHCQQVGENESEARPIKMKVNIDGTPLEIEVSDITQADAALQLALKYRSMYPIVAKQVTAKSKVSVQGRVPPRKRRPRR